MRFDQLVARLPGIRNPVTTVSPAHSALEPSPGVVTGYVKPCFEEISWPSDPHIVLVEAAGAVGKTSAAEAIADSTKWPLIRAERAQVGSYSLSGLIQDALGFESSYLQQIAFGRAGLVVDSLDEAHLLAGTQNFLAFLDNVQSISRRATTQQGPPTIVLLSRSDTAELVQLFLDEAAVPFAHLRLDFFDQVSAEQFIDLYLRKRYEESRRPDYNVALASPLPFAQLRRERFIRIISAITRKSSVDLQKDWAAARDFVGYAPVLIALAESLAVSNPAAERARVAKSQPSELTGLLWEIIQRILIREQQKFVSQLRDKLIALLPADQCDEVDFTTFYSAEEQVARIFSLVTNDEGPAWPQADLAGEAEVAYAVAATQFTSEHPFVRNRGFASTVFGDFVQARICLDPDLRRRLKTDPCSIVENVGAFFLDFSHGIVREHTSSIPETLIDAVLRSWYAQLELTSGVEPEATLVIGNEWGVLMLSVGTQVNSSHIDLPISESSGALSLRAPLKNMSVFCEQGLILGSSDYSSMLGPNVIIAASELEIETRSLNIVGPSSGGRGGVILGAKGIRADRLIKVGGATDALQVVVPNAPPLLRPFTRRNGIQIQGVPFEDYVSLRALLSSFRSTVHLGICAPKDRISAVIGGHDQRKVILDTLLRRGVLQDRGEWYTFDSSAMKVLGFSFTDVRGGSPTDPILEFLANCRR